MEGATGAHPAMDKDPERIEEAIFAAAAAKPPGERAAYLDAACGGDDALRRSIAELIAAHEAPGTLIEGAGAPGGDPSTVHLPGKAEAGAMPRPGRRIGYLGDYELVEEIACGAMGVVYRANQRSLNRSVALKMIRGSLLASEAEVRRFQTEAEAAAGLDHPSIVPIYEIGTHEGQHYFTMKLVEGGTLADRMEAYRDDPNSAARLLATVARAVDAAHRHGILHRDLKPGNILLDRDGQPHVTDFGLAKQLESENALTLSGQILGTPYYMAPEQAEGNGKRLTTAADIYSLGAILYEMLTGRPPFKGDTVLETLRCAREEDVKPPHLVAADSDRDLETIALKCLRKRPEHRYPSAAALADDLDRRARGEPIAARPVTRTERVVKWVRRKPVHAALLGTAAILILTLGVGGPLVAIKQSRLRETADKQRLKAEAAETVAESRAEEIRRNLYFAEMNLAGEAAAEPGGLARVVGLLGKWVPKTGVDDLRGWEWYYLRSLSARDAATFYPQAGTLHSVAWSPDGSRVAAAGWSGISLLDAASGEGILKLAAHKAPVKAVSWRPDGDRLASAGVDGTVRTWDAATGEEIRSFGGHTGTVWSVGWSPDGSRLALEPGLRREPGHTARACP